MKLLRFSLIFFLFYIYCYSIVFTFFPVSTKILLGGIGLIYTIFKLASGRLRLKKEFVWILKYSVILCLWDTVLSVISGYYQFHFFELIKTPIGSLFGAGLLYELSKPIIKTEKDFLLFFVFVVFTECALTIIMSMMPSIFNLVMSIQVTDMGNKEVTDIEGYYRMIGIGNAVYFGVLPICAFALLSCSYLISNNLVKSFSLAFVIIAFLFIGVASFFSARTSLALVAIALLPILFNFKSVGIKNIILLSIVLFVSLLFGIKYIESNFNDSMLDWAFSFLVNKDSDSGSIGEVVEWWEKTEFNPLTFIIGDGCYENPDGSYYKRVDIGWFRIIFYCGIIGLSMILYFHYKISKFIYNCNKNRNLFLMLFLLFLSYAVILAKGDTLMLTFLILFLVYYKGGIFDPQKMIKSNNNISDLNNYGLQNNY